MQHFRRRLAGFIPLALALSACSTTPPERQPETEFKGRPGKLAEGYHADLREVEYPYSLSEFVVNEQGQVLRMVYMDIRPEGKPVGTFVLLHGKNFSGAYFRNLIVLLWKRGYRVIAPDQVGFGKSSKPDCFQYSFQALATNTRKLLDHLQIPKARILGHSMGGMLAARFALMFPEQVERLYLVNPIGLEDARLSVPYRGLDDLYQDEKKLSPEAIRAYQRQNYYGGEWKPAYEEWVQIPIGLLNGPDFLQVAKVNALTTDMIYTQPVVYELDRIKVPTTFIIGTRDRTAIGRAWAPASVQEKIGDVRKLARDAVKRIPKARLIELEGVGHVPFVENLPKFWAELLKAL
jgi:pimeloyl-ACP methyl ester carboxylesterase